MKIFAGESNLEEVDEVGRNLGYAGDMIDEDFDRTKNLTWDQFQNLLDAVDSDITEESLTHMIVDYILNNAELEGQEDWDEDGDYSSEADQEFDWEWEKDGFYFHVKGKIYGNIDSDPGDDYTPPSSDERFTDLDIYEALVGLGNENIEAFEDRTEWDSEGEAEQYYDLCVEIPANRVEAEFKREIGADRV